ncbi:MAG TPA: M1 family peptidase, partial [Sphingobacteriaceae bacterium]
MKFIKPLLVLALLYAFKTSNGQLTQPKDKFTRADTLRGMLTPPRTSYDINYYHLDVKVDIENRYISGSNLFRFTANRDFRRLQFDLFDNMKVERITYKGKELSFKREFNAVFVDFPATIKKGAKDQFTVYYGGNPAIAKNAPWDGG